MKSISATLSVLQARSHRGGKGQTRGTGRRASRPLHVRNLRLESLEDRTLLNASIEFHHVIFAAPNHGALTSFSRGGGRHVIGPLASSPPASAFTPQQIRTAYGINSIAGDGAGQTIAIVDAYDDPNIAGDLQTFNSQFGLATCGFTKLNQNGVAGSYPTAAGTSGWSVEITLDVEWAHAIAPAPVSSWSRQTVQTPAIS